MKEFCTAFCASDHAGPGTHQGFSFADRRPNFVFEDIASVNQFSLLGRPFNSHFDENDLSVGRRRPVFISVLLARCNGIIAVHRSCVAANHTARRPHCAAACEILSSCVGKSSPAKCLVRLDAISKNRARRLKFGTMVAVSLVGEALPVPLGCASRHAALSDISLVLDLLTSGLRPRPHQQNCKANSRNSF